MMMETSPGDEETRLNGDNHGGITTEEQQQFLWFPATSTHHDDVDIDEYAESDDLFVTTSSFPEINESDDPGPNLLVEPGFGVSDPTAEDQLRFQDHDDDDFAEGNTTDDISEGQHRDKIKFESGENEDLVETALTLGSVTVTDPEMSAFMSLDTVVWNKTRGGRTKRSSQSMNLRNQQGIGKGRKPNRTTHSKKRQANEKQDATSNKKVSPVFHFSVNKCLCSLDPSSCL